MSDSDPRYAALLVEVFTYYRQPVTDTMLGWWCSALQPYDFGAVQRAIEAHVRSPDTGQFPPKIADLVRALDGGTSSEQSLHAWSKVFGAVAQVGQYRTVAFDDPAIHAAVADMGGWPALCRSLEGEAIQFQQVRFCKTHRAYVTRTDGYQYPAVLRGDIDGDDAYVAKGLPPPKPAYVGVYERCVAVMLGGQGAGKVPERLL